MSFSLWVAPLAGARIETLRSCGRVIDKVSLPSRERELKHRRAETTGCKNLSLPSRERELKLSRAARRKKVLPSLPSRERELKPHRCYPDD